MAPNAMQCIVLPNRKRCVKPCPTCNERQEFYAAFIQWWPPISRDALPPWKEFHSQQFLSLSLSLWDIRKHLVREPCDKGFNSFSHFITQCSLKSEDVFPLHRCSHFLCCFCSLCFLLLPSMAFFICNSRFIMLPPFVPFILLVFLPLKVRAFVLFFSFPSQFVFFVSRTEWWQ